MTLDRHKLDRAFHDLAAEPLDVDLPDPAHVYWRARVLERLARRTEAAERAERPVRWVQALAGTVVLALLAATAALLVLGGLSQGPELIVGLAGELAPGVGPGLVQVVFLGGLALLGAAAVVGLQLAVGER